MRSLYRLAALAVGVGVMCVSGMARAEPAEKISLNILYMGQPESARANDFAQFLREHFAKVEVMDAAKFDPGADGGVQRRHPRLRSRLPGISASWRS